MIEADFISSLALTRISSEQSEDFIQARLDFIAVRRDFIVFISPTNHNLKNKSFLKHSFKLSFVDYFDTEVLGFGKLTTCGFACDDVACFL